MAVTWKKIAFTDSALIPASVDLNAGSLRLPSNTSALTTTEAYAAWESTRKVLRVYDASRERTIGHVGFSPHAYPLGTNAYCALSSSATLAAVSGGNAGALAAPIHVPSHMLLQSLVIYQSATSLARSAEWRLYEDRNDASNTLNEIANANGTFSFTPTAASNVTSTPASPPIYLAPGIYWLVIRNTHATQTFLVGTEGTPAIYPNLHQTKSIGALGSTLDLVAATWTKLNSAPGLYLRGRVFGQTTAF